jgi:branched-chain amino acid transport system permease protein
MSQFWDIYGITFEFAFVLGLFALSAFLGLWSGVLSLAPIAYASGAAYVSARLAYDKVMMGEANYPLVFHLFVGMVVGGFLAWITSFVLLRLGSHYLALATIALVLIARVIALNLDEYTGGTVGIPVPRQITTWHILLILGVVSVMFGVLRKSRFGYSLDAVREQPEVASSLGINVQRVRRYAFTFAGVLGGLAGVLQAQLVQYLVPETLYVELAFISIASAVLGGAYIWVGPIVGALLYTAIPEFLEPFLGSSKNVVNGILLVIIMVFLQRGLIDPRQFRAWSLKRKSRQTKEVAS